MLLIPAIDLHEGKCVQLKRGLLDSVSVYSDDPASMARHWVDQGARRRSGADPAVTRCRSGTGTTISNGGGRGARKF